jgi:hypothetical protein
VDRKFNQAQNIEILIKEIIVHKPFVKTFDSPTLGQLVLMSKINDHGDPEIRIFDQPEGLNVRSMAIGFVCNDEGYAARDKFFDTATLQKAEVMAVTLFVMARKLNESEAAS